MSPEAEKNKLKVLNSPADYTIWSIDMRALLTEKRLQNTITSKLTPEQMTEEEQQNTAIAYSKIVRTVSPHYKLKIASCETAKEAWDLLKKECAYDAKLDQLNAKDKLMKLKKQGNQTMTEHILNFESALYNLRNTGKELPQDELIDIFIASLPKSKREDAYDRVERMNPPTKTIETFLQIMKQRARHYEDNESDEEIETTYKHPRNAALHTSKPFNKQRNVNNIQNRRYEFPFRLCDFCERWHHGRCNLKQQRSQTNKDDAMLIEKFSSISLVAQETALEAELNDTSEWIIDSGATSHMTNSLHGMTIFIRTHGETIKAAGNQVIEVEGHGTKTFKVRQKNGELTTVSLNNVLYLPKLRKNLIAVAACTQQKGITVEFSKKVATIKLNGKPLIRGIVHRNLYCVTSSNVIEKPNQGAETFLASASNTLEDWHKILGHVNENSIKKMASKNLVTGMEIVNIKKQLEHCETCHANKAKRVSFTGTLPRYSHPLEEISVDLIGPLEVESFKGHKYILNIVDSASRFGAAIPLIKKGDAFEQLKIIVNGFENHTCRSVKRIRCDNGKEFINKEMTKWKEMKGIEIQLTTPYTSEMNPIVERRNQTLMTMTRCLLHDSSLSKAFWSEAVQYANYIINRTPNSFLETMTPYEAFHGSKPDLKHLKQFGSKAYITLGDKSQCGKLGERSIEGIFVNHCTNPRQYTFVIPHLNNKIIQSVHARFVKSNAKEYNSKLTSVENTKLDLEVSSDNSTEMTDEDHIEDWTDNEKTPSIDAMDLITNHSPSNSDSESESTMQKRKPHFEYQAITAPAPKSFDYEVELLRKRKASLSEDSMNARKSARLSMRNECNVVEIIDSRKMNSVDI